MAAHPLTFDIQEPGRPPRRTTTSGSVLKIGRNSEFALGLDDGTVARMHAVIEVTEDGSVVIVDLGSERQTQVNGVPVNKAELHVGDQIRIGDSTLTLLAIGDVVLAGTTPSQPIPPAFAPAAQVGPSPIHPPGPWRWDDPAPQRAERRPSWTLVVLLMLAVLGLGLALLVR